MIVFGKDAEGIAEGVVPCLYWVSNEMSCYLDLEVDFVVVVVADDNYRLALMAPFAG